MLQHGKEPQYVMKSKKRCVELGMNPDVPGIPKNMMTELELSEKREAYSEILEVANLLSNKIINSLKGTPILVVISDADGFLLDYLGDETIKSTVTQLGIKPGIQFSEEDMGTNVVSLTLKQNHPVQLIGDNHFHSFLHTSACYGVPFHYTDDNSLLGSICIMTAVILHNPFFLMTLDTVVDSIERELLLRKQNRKLNKIAEENKKLLEQTLEYDKLKTEFFSNISHEIRTPLNIILSAIQLLESLQNDECKTENDFSFTFKKYIKIIKQNGFRLLRLINNIIDITKIDNGFAKVNLYNHNIVSVVEDITLSVSDYANSKGIELIFDTEVEEKIMPCDEEKIERIMLNLLSNSIKYTKPGGSIEVDVKDLGTSIRIGVKDSGIGIPNDKIGIIFQRFRQVDELLTRKTEGSGIGLSLVKSFVEAHGGTISVNSTYGIGSEFVIILPCGESKNGEISNKHLECLNYDNKIEKINIELSDIYK